MPRRRRSLITLAVVGAAGYLAGKIVEQVREDEAAEYTRLTAPTQSGPSTETSIEQLKELGRLHAQDVLNDEEFAAAKARLLSAG